MSEAETKKEMTTELGTAFGLTVFIWEEPNSLGQSVDLREALNCCPVWLPLMSENSASRDNTPVNLNPDCLSTPLPSQTNFNNLYSHYMKITSDNSDNIIYNARSKFC